MKVLFEMLLENLGLVIQAPIAFTLLSVISISIGFWISRIITKQQIENLKSERDLKKTKLEQVEKAVSKEVKEIEESSDANLTIFDFSGENSDSEKNLLKSLSEAKNEIFVFGLTRNFYADDRIQRILKEKSSSIPINIFMMDPDCDSKKDRYRLEPSRAAYRNASVYKDKVEKTFIRLLGECKSTWPGSKDPGISFHYYNFPCAFAIEKIDSVIRVFLYGYGKRGTDSPTFVYSEGHSSYSFFDEQVEWIKEHANGNATAQWEDSDLKFYNLANKSSKKDGDKAAASS